MNAPFRHSESTHRRDVLFWIAWLALPFLALGFQVTAKLLAGALSGQGIGLDWLSLLVHLPAFKWLLLFEILSFIAWIHVLNEMPLSEAFPLSAVSYVLIVLASWVVFREDGSWLQVLGSFAILSGVWLISRTDESGEDE